MKKLKLLGLILTFCLCFAIALPAWAADTSENCILPTDTQQDRLVELLQFVASCNTPGYYDDVDFSSISVGRSIPNYNYTEDGFEPLRTMFPIFSGSELIGIATESEDTGLFAFNNFLSEQIKKYVDETTEFALVFDQKCCYLFDGNEWILLKEYSYFDSDDAVLNTYARMDTSTIKLNSLNEKVELPDISTDESNVETLTVDATRDSRYECAITPVWQTGSETCWAASLATIINFRNGTYLNDVDVAKAYYGNNYDQGLSVSKGTAVLSMYGITNYSNGSNPKGVQIANNISRQYPVYANFNISGSNYHACVVNAIEVSFNYVSVWDPDNGWDTAYKQSDNIYALDNTKHVYRLTRAAMPSWS